MNLDEPTTQEQFGRLVGVTHKAIEKHIAKGVLREGATAGEWLRSYCERLRAEASQRRGDESTALTRARTREAESRARMLQLSVQRELARLIPLEVIEPDLRAWSDFAWSEAQGLVGRVVDEIEQRHEIEIDRDLYAGPLDSARAAIQAYPNFENHETERATDD